MRITIDIPMEGYLVKYMRVELPGDPYVVDERDYAAIVLMNLLNKKDRNPYRINRTITPNYFSVALGDKMMNRFRLFTISQENAMRFAKYAKRLFYRDLERYVQARSEIIEGRPKIFIRESILLFCEKYQISEDDLPFENLRKHIYRSVYSKNKPAILVPG